MPSCRSFYIYKHHVCHSALAFAYAVHLRTICAPGCPLTDVWGGSTHFQRPSVGAIDAPRRALTGSTINKKSAKGFLLPFLGRGSDIWITTRKEKLLWAGGFCVEDIRSHSVDQKVQYLHLSKVEKCTPQQMANWYADKWAKAYLKKMRSKREFVSARPVAIEKGARWRLYHKGALVAGAITKRIKEIVEHNLVQCYFRSKARESSCRLGETKTDHWGLLLDTAVYSAARAKWELKRQAQKFPWQILSLWYPIELETGNRGRDFSTRPRNPAATKGRCQCGKHCTLSHIITRTVGMPK